MTAIELDTIVDSEGAGPGPSTLRHRQESHEAKRGATSRSRDRPVGVTVATTLGLTHCFTTFTLPSEYDRFPLVARLWLQSRVRPPSSWSNADDDSDDEEDEGIKLIPAAEARKITWANFKVSLDLLRLLGPRVSELIWEHRDVLALPSFVYLLSVVADGVVPAAA